MSRRSPEHPQVTQAVVLSIHMEGRVIGGYLEESSNDGTTFYYMSKINTRWVFGTYRIPNGEHIFDLISKAIRSEDPLKSSQVHQFAYTSGGVGLGIPFSSYGSAQIAVIDADSMRDITGLGWYAGGALAAGASGTAGTYSAPFWLQDSSYKITSVGYAAGAAGGVSTGITYTWNVGSTDFANLPGMTIDALRKATQQVDGCK
jgi:hypothetical protein